MFKYCPQCGKPQSTPGSARPFSCAHCGFTYFHNTAAAVAGIIQVDNEILFTRRAKDPGSGRLDLPGGFVDPDESLQQALSREVHEELGLSISNWQFLASYANHYPYKNVEYFTCDAVFFCQLSSKPELTLEQHEISQVVWVDKAEFEGALMAFDSLKQAVETFLQAQSN